MTYLFHIACKRLRNAESHFQIWESPQLREKEASGNQIRTTYSQARAHVSGGMILRGIAYPLLKTPKTAQKLAAR